MGRGVVRTSRRAIRVVALIGVLLLAGTGIVLAVGGIPGTNGIISACFAKLNGQLRVVPEGSSCRPDETALSFNQQGPRGDPGPAGAKGDSGPRGPSDAFTVAAQGPLTLQPTPTRVAQLNLPAGKFVLSAEVWLANESSTIVAVTCELKAGVGSSKSGATLESSGANTATVSVTLGQELASPSTADLSCTSTGGGGALARMRSAQLTGLMVGSLVQATIGAPSHALTVAKRGGGSGSVDSSPAGISCGTNCVFSYPDGTQVTLSATAVAPSFFGGWSGACPTTPAQCVITVDAPKNVAAAFVIATATADYAASFATPEGTFISEPSPSDGAPDPAVWIWSRAGTVRTIGASVRYGVQDFDDGGFLLFSHPTTPICAASKTALLRAHVRPSSVGLFVFFQDVTHGFRLILDDGCRRLELKLVIHVEPQGGVIAVIEVEGTPGPLRLAFPWRVDSDQTYEIDRLANGDFVIQAAIDEPTIPSQSLSVPASSLPATTGRPEFVWGTGLFGRGQAIWSTVHGEVP